MTDFVFCVYEQLAHVTAMTGSDHKGTHTILLVLHLFVLLRFGNRIKVLGEGY